MAHEVAVSAGVNGYIRQVRSMALDAPRVMRADDHTDILNLGVDYKLSGGGSDRAAGDILQVCAEPGAPLTLHRATCVVVGGDCSYGTQEVDIDVDFSVGGKTITNNDAVDFTTNFTVGDLVRVDGSTSNDQVYRISAIGGTGNSVITLETEDTLSGSETGEVVTLTPVGGGAIFRVREDEGSGNNFIGWLAQETEFMAIDGSTWLFLRTSVVTAWALGDYAEFTFERGPFSLHDNLGVTRTVDLNENGGSADTITRTDYNGNFLRDGFFDGGIVEIEDSAGEDGRYLITTVTATTITLAIGALTGDELAVEVRLTPRNQVASTPVLVISTDDTITRSDGGSWIDEGFLDGGLLELQDTVSNDGIYLIKGDPTDTVLTIDGGEGLVAETLPATITVTPRNSILNAWTEHRLIWGATTASPVNSQTLDSGELPPIPNTDGNYTLEWVAIAPGDDPVNNAQTIYLGWQSQFASASIQNVELRGFDAVSDSPFGSLGNASPPAYIYMNLDPSLELYMTADGAHLTGFADVNTTATEWFYLGFCNIHGSNDQHPRPIMVGGAGFDPDGSLSGDGARYEFFPAGVSKDSGVSTSPVIDPPESSCWHRWVDGQHMPVALWHLPGGNDTGTELQNVTTNMLTYPYYGSGVNQLTFPFNDDADDFGPMTASNPNGRPEFMDGLRATPVGITNPREYVLLPTLIMMVNPDFNIVGNFRNVFFTPGTGQATKNTIDQGGFVYVVGQNHKSTGQLDFAALRLN